MNAEEIEQIIGGGDGGCWEEPHMGWDIPLNVPKAAAEIARRTQAEILIEHNLAVQRGRQRDAALAQLREMRELLRAIRNHVPDIEFTRKISRAITKGISSTTEITLSNQPPNIPLL